MGNLLVVIDMVNGFVNGGNLADSKINKITPNIISLIEKAKSNNDMIIDFRDCHVTNDKEFEVFPEHCIRGTTECELIPELLVYKSDMIDIEKQTTNGFNTLEFMSIISSNKFDIITVCGCCTDICVETFCLSLKEYLDNYNISTQIIVHENSVYTFDSLEHNARQFHLNSLKNLENAGINVIY